MSEKEAQALIAKAEKKASSFSWFGGSGKYEEAAELYCKAANQFKLAKRWQEAGQAFCKASEMLLQNKEVDEAASSLIDAARCFKKCSPEDAISSLRKAIEIMTDKGRFNAAANHQKEIAEIYESDLVDLQRAMDAYEIAADWYAGEERPAVANSCWLKVAHFAAQLEQYDKAIERFEQVANASVDNQLTRWSLKDYFLKAGLCHLCLGDAVGTQRAIERYCDMDVTFGSTRECQFLQSILEAYEAGDVEMFTQKVFEFDQLMKLDNWKTTVLLRIKRSISEEPALT
ncbi:uncharacterized protein VTP21DRAFT_2423 [Calcarisporiella thermophila]|uniref:uncharacterized protein n=1 Tax=Calcarisporiella thermophila TaxID=911321 RepID=UPI0037446C86